MNKQEVGAIMSNTLRRLRSSVPVAALLAFLPVAAHAQLSPDQWAKTQACWAAEIQDTKVNPVVHGWMVARRDLLVNNLPLIQKLTASSMSGADYVNLACSGNDELLFDTYNVRAHNGSFHVVSPLIEAQRLADEDARELYTLIAALTICALLLVMFWPTAKRRARWAFVRSPEGRLARAAVRNQRAGVKPGDADFAEFNKSTPYKRTSIADFKRRAYSFRKVIFVCLIIDVLIWFGIRTLNLPIGRGRENDLINAAMAPAGFVLLIYLARSIKASMNATRLTKLRDHSDITRAAATYAAASDQKAKAAEFRAQVDKQNTAGFADMNSQE